MIDCLERANDVGRVRVPFGIASVFPASSNNFEGSSSNI